MRNATSGSITSAPSMAFAFFARRCVSMTSCPESDTSRAGAWDCSLSAWICSARSSSTGLLLLIWRTEVPRPIRFLLCASTSCALRSVLSHSLVSASRYGFTVSELGGRETSPACPPRVSSLSAAMNSSRDCCSCLNASGLPMRPVCAALAMRWLSMRICAAVET